MKTTLIIFLASIFVAAARLGESNTEIMKRYGAVTQRMEDSPTEWSALYVFKEYKIVVSYQTNTCVAEMLRPISNRQLNDVEVLALLKNIGGNTNWVKDESTLSFTKENWINPDTKARAQVETSIGGGSTLFVASSSFLKSESEKKKAKDKSKAEGF